MEFSNVYTMCICTSAGPAWPCLDPLGPAWSHKGLLSPAWPRLAPLGHYSISISRYLKVPISQCLNGGTVHPGCLMEEISLWFRKILYKKVECMEILYL